MVGSCLALASIANGSITAPSLVTGASAVYSCQAGYILAGASTRTCLPDGKWSGTEPVCSLANCGTLVSPSNGTVALSASTYGAVATYSCSTGYSLSGSATRTCQSNSTWSGAAPTCSIVNCGSLPAPTNGSVAASITTYGATAQFSCNAGYSLSSTTNRTCQASGTWSGASPTCVSRCPTGMVFVPGGTYTMSQLASTPTVASLCYDIDLVTTAQYSACTSCVPATAADTTTVNYCNTGISYRTQDPVNCVSQTQSAYYCSSLSKRLPTDAEFEWVARGASAASTYPWGSTAPLASDSPARLCWIAAREGFAGWPARPAGTCPVGSYDVAGKSPLGIHDLSGNVWEWTSTLYNSSGYVARGGGWDNNDSSRMTAGFRNGPFPATISHYALGFRCVATPAN